MVSNDFGNGTAANLKRTIAVSCNKSVYPISSSDRAHALLINVLASLQKCINLENVVPASCSQEYPASSHDEIEIVSANIAEGTDVQKKVDPVAITFNVVKAEHEVSSIYVSIVRFFFIGIRFL